MKRIAFLMTTALPSVALAHEGHPHYTGSESHLVEALVGLGLTVVLGLGAYALVRRRRAKATRSH